MNAAQPNEFALTSATSINLALTASSKKAAIAWIAITGVLAVAFVSSSVLFVQKYYLFDTNTLIKVIYEITVIAC
jgi:hypothetical protein